MVPKFFFFLRLKIKHWNTMSHLESRVRHTEGILETMTADE